MKGNNMQRRNFVFGLGAAAVGSFALAVNQETIKTIVVGHAKDAVSRFTHEDEFAEGTVVRRGTFDQNARGRDAAHWADGTVEILDTNVIQLGADFNSGPLPDGWVCLHPNLDLQDESDTFTDELIYLEPLKAGKGAQTYELPATLQGEWSLVIVCRRFQEYIGSANLTEL